MDRYQTSLRLRSAFALALLSVIGLLYGCQSRVRQAGQQLVQLEADSIDFTHPVRFDYAKWVRVNNQPRHKELVILTPGTIDTLATYILYPRSSGRPKGLKATDIAIAVPVQRIACLSTPQIGALPLLGAVDRLVGASKLEDISNPEVRQHIGEGKVLEIGRGMSENKEAILMARPEVLLQDFSNVDTQDNELIDNGIVPFLFNSWKEQDLLGRAEWLKVSGMLLGLNQRADSVFSRIAEDYQESRQIAANAKDTIPILYGMDYKGTWYLPGEYSYPTAMFRDAGLKYDYVSGESNSTPVSFEYIFAHHRYAKIWVGTMGGRISTKAEFTALNERYTYFDAAKEGGKIFLDCKRMNQSGGNDYWESGPYRPDLILKDLIKMTRPELLPDYELYYFVELK